MQPTFCISTSTSQYPIVDLTGANKPAIGGFPIYATSTCPNSTQSLSTSTITQIQIVDQFGNVQHDTTILIPFLSLLSVFMIIKFWVKMFGKV